MPWRLITPGALPPGCDDKPSVVVPGRIRLTHTAGCDRFRRGWPQPQCPIGTNLVVVSSPTFHEHLGFMQRICRFADYSVGIGSSVYAHIRWAKNLYNLCA